MAATKSRKVAETDVPTSSPDLLQRRQLRLDESGGDGDRNGQSDHDRRMAEGKVEADADRPFAVLHEFSRDVVDRRDVIGIDGMPQSEGVRQQRGSEQDRV